MLELGIKEKEFHSEISNNDNIKFFDKQNIYSNERITFEITKRTKRCQ